MKATIYLKSHVTVRGIAFVLLVALGGLLIATDYMFTKGALMP
jgi:hypothetical protein